MQSLKSPTYRKQSVSLGLRAPLNLRAGICFLITLECWGAGASFPEHCPTPPPQSVLLAWPRATDLTPQTCPLWTSWVQPVKCPPSSTVPRNPCVPPRPQKTSPTPWSQSPVSSSPIPRPPAGARALLGLAMLILSPALCDLRLAFPCLGPPSPCL